jgi:hypothetical protein
MRKAGAYDKRRVRIGNGSIRTAHHIYLKRRLIADLFPEVDDLARHPGQLNPVRL